MNYEVEEMSALFPTSVTNCHVVLKEYDVFSENFFISPLIFKG